MYDWDIPERYFKRRCLEGQNPIKIREFSATLANADDCLRLDEMYAQRTFATLLDVYVPPGSQIKRKARAVAGIVTVQWWLTLRSGSGSGSAGVPDA